MHRACGVIDTACTHACGVNASACIFNFALFEVVRKFFVHAVSMTPLAFLKIQISARIRIYIQKGFSPLIP
jgi:hypothetical protein